MKKTKGKFIVIDGTDGSGKATQTKLLVSRLKENGHKIKTIDFPQYKKNVFGKMVGRYLSGEFGSASEVNPYLASTLYAADRFEAKDKILKWLKSGYIVIADRYASSNQIHQGGKIKDNEERKTFLDWLEIMEYQVFKIPKPDGIIYLDVPLKFTVNLLKEKKAQAKKQYLKGMKDIHENDLEHLQDAKESAIKLVKSLNNWTRIDCVKNNKLMSIKEIHSVVWNKLKKII
jgi:dTMP kinase